jgi:hypothetical protein
MENMEDGDNITIMDKLQRFDTLFGWVIRWFALILVAGILFFADKRYVTAEEAKLKESQYHKIRQDDLLLLNKQIESIRDEAHEANKRSGVILERLNRIEAQGEIMLRYFERDITLNYIPTEKISK